MLIILFGLSTAGIFLLVGMKMIEIRMKRKLPVTVFLGKFDSIIANHGETIQLAIDQKKETTRIFIKHELPRHVKYLFFVTRKNVEEKYDEFFPNIRGIRTLKKDGTVSPYLQDIARHKEEQGKGLILEEVVYSQDPRSEV